MISHQMLRELLLRLQHEFRDLPAALRDLWNEVGYPGLVTLVIAAILGYAVLKIKRLFFMAPEELHREALTLLSHRSGSKGKEAEQLLQRAVAMDYTPAQISLAALYAYQQKSPDDALRVLSGDKDLLNQDGKGIRLDALAIKAGNGSMIQAELRALEFLSVAYADAVDASGDHQAADVTEPSETKKER